MRPAILIFYGNLARHALSASTTSLVLPPSLRITVPTKALLRIRVPHISHGVMQRIRYLLHPLIVSLRRILQLRVHPAFRIAAPEINDPQVVVSVDHEVVRFRISPDNTIFVQELFHR